MATPKRLKDRSTAELVVLALTLTVCIVILGFVAFILVLSVHRPSVELAEVARNISDVINVLIGALVGYLAGTRQSKKDRDDGDEQQG